jgi:hypothetical protein
MIFHEDFNVLIIANKQDVAKNLVLKVRTMNQLLPVWLRVAESEDNKLSLRLKNGSQVKAVSSKPDSGRSEALSLLVFDEAAFIDYIDEIWTGTQLTLATGGDCIALSTPNGVGNWFHRMWVGAENGTNLFNPIKLHWTVHPDREQDWRDEQTKQLGDKQAAQECDCDFISSGDNVIDGELLQWYTDNLIQDPVEKKGFDGNFWVWKRPDYTRTYVVTADVARGDGADYSAFHIIDAESCEQVAEYKGKIEPVDFGNMLISAATEYNDALLIVDNANIGWATIQQILDRIKFDDITLTNISLFPNSDYDVLKFDAAGVGLKEANEILMKLPNSNDYPNYHPHMTVAYLNKGTAGNEYVKKFMNLQFKVTPIFAIYSVPSGKKYKLKIK